MIPIFSLRLALVGCLEMQYNATQKESRMANAATHPAPLLANNLEDYADSLR